MRIIEANIDIIALIGGAQKSVVMGTYVPPKHRFLDMLNRAIERGVEVTVYCDRGVALQSTEPLPDFVRPTMYYGRAVHAKFIIIDDELAVVGSHNFDDSGSFNLSIVTDDEPTLIQLRLVAEVLANGVTPTAVLAQGASYSDLADLVDFLDSVKAGPSWIGDVARNIRRREAATSKELRLIESAVTQVPRYALDEMPTAALHPDFIKEMTK